MISENPLITRFAPSPTGYLHLGHAYAAWFAEQIAKEALYKASAKLPIKTKFIKRIS